MPQKKNIQPMIRAAQFVPSSYNESKNTVTLVAASESEVLQRTWDGTINEILSMQPGHVRLERLNAGANVIDNHDHRYTSVRDSVLGVVTRAWVEDGKLMCEVRFSNREDIKGFIQDVRDGIQRNISIGYRVYKYEITEEEGKIPVYRATDWEPFEVSFVAVPADFVAGVRNHGDANNQVEIVTTNSNNNNMKRSSEILKLVRAAGLSIDFAQTLIDDESITVEQAQEKISAEKVRVAGSAPAPVNTPAAPAPAPVATAEAPKADRKRASEILSAVRAANFSIEYAQELIDDETMTVDQARAAIINKLAESGTQSRSQAQAKPNTTVTADERDKERTLIVTNLAIRSGLDVKHLDKDAIQPSHQFRGYSLLDIAKYSLERAGIDYKGLDKMDIVGRAFTSSTSDFPIILENVMHKMLLSSYNTVADTWSKWCRRGTVSDFRAHNRYRMGSFSRLDKMTENGEYKSKKINDAEKNSITADTFGNMINISRKMIINDDVQAFNDLALKLGRAAGLSVEIDAYALLASNPTMGDGVALFHANHGNLVTGAAMSVAEFDKLRTTMAKQKDKDSNDFLDMRPSILLCGIDKGGDAKVINDAQYDTDTADKLQKPNKVRGLFSQIVDTPRITGNEYYAFADPNVEPVIEVAFLDGNSTPYLESKEGWKVDGTEWKVRMDYGVAAVGYRGAVKNPGA